ncbi:hypothetical protein [Atlantibacter hermannii]|nr:hypothetical protein [Atlantibacter hermannii]
MSGDFYRWDGRYLRIFATLASTWQKIRYPCEASRKQVYSLKE